MEPLHLLHLRHWGPEAAGSGVLNNATLEFDPCDVREHRVPAPRVCRVHLQHIGRYVPRCLRASRRDGIGLRQDLRRASRPDTSNTYESPRRAVCVLQNELRREIRDANRIAATSAAARMPSVSCRPHSTRFERWAALATTPARFPQHSRRLRSSSPSQEYTRPTSLDSLKNSQTKIFSTVIGHPGRCLEARSMITQFFLAYKSFLRPRIRRSIHQRMLGWCAR